LNVPDLETYLTAERRQTGDTHGISAAIRGYLTAAREYLRGLHTSGASGQRVNEIHSDLLDRLVRAVFELAEEMYFSGRDAEGEELCVVAVGGYARREMSFYSDVDLLFLHRGDATPYVAAITERVQRWLWDAQLTVGCATRTIEETIGLALQDTTVCTAVLAPRFIAGSGVLFHRLGDAVRTRLMAKPGELIAALFEGRQKRHERFGASLYLLQPNVKESAGGLRDFHASYWTMQALQASVRGKDDFLHLGLLTEVEAVAYFDALEFLWRIRNEMHLQAGRKHDQMSFDMQERIARTFGYVGGGDLATELPVERFMRDYYRHARNVLNLSSLIMEQCLARTRRAAGHVRTQWVERGFRIVDGRLEIPHARQLRSDPALLLEAFAVAQAHDVGITRKAQRILRENLYLIDDAFRSKPEIIEIFLRILRSPQRITRSLIAMNEVGLLGRFLPEWDHIVCRWQHVMYHTYTVDVHSIFLVEELRRLIKGDYDDELPSVARLARSVSDPTVLYLGCLFHDLGKGFGGNHSSKGAVRARACLQRLGMDAEAVERVAFLVEQHLRMAHVAQRRDLSDPRVIFEFARTSGDRTNLKLLYLLTVADIRASSKTAWTDWKGRLLKELFERASELLETGTADAGRAVELIERRVEARRSAAAAELAKQGVDETTVAQYFDMWPRRYFMAHSPSQIARHARVVLDFEPDLVMTTAFREMRGGFAEFILCTRDVHGLYSNVAGVLTAHHLNILGSNVYTSTSGLALETYRVATPRGGEEERALAWVALERSLRQVLKGEVSVSSLLRRRGRRVARIDMPSADGGNVTITNDESDFYTIIDVTANDRLGLLHDLTRAISEHGCEVYISKAGRVLDQVADTFYVKDIHDRKLEDPEAIASLRRDLLASARAGSHDAE
jgi:[protein-PII] uridylyltransferase